jgi:hypothetical protein
VNPRPAIGDTPMTGSSEGVIGLPVNCSGSPLPLRLKVPNPTAASCSVCVCSFHDR